MEATSGSEEVGIALIDGPVDVDHPGLVGARLQVVEGAARCSSSGEACAHGTFVAGVLVGRPSTGVPAICPACRLLLRPIFTDSSAQAGLSATTRELAEAITACVNSGARVVNVSAAVLGEDREGKHAISRALDHASRTGALVIAAAGNDRKVGGSIVTRHPWVLPVIAYTRAGKPMEASQLGRSVGTRGLGAPGERVLSLAPGGATQRSGGTSAATAFVSGAAALIWSLVPNAPAAAVRFSLLRAARESRRGIVPPLLNGWNGYQTLMSLIGRR